MLGEVKTRTLERREGGGSRAVMDSKERRDLTQIKKGEGTEDTGGRSKTGETTTRLESRGLKPIEGKL